MQTTNSTSLEKIPSSILICPSTKAETKKLIKSLLSYNKQVEQNIFKSAENVNIDKILGYKVGDKKVFYLDEYDKKS